MGAGKTAFVKHMGALLIATLTLMCAACDTTNVTINPSSAPVPVTSAETIVVIIDPPSDTPDPDHATLPPGYVPATLSPSDEPVAPAQTPDPEKKYIALSYDDGPDEEKTFALLDILRENDVRVTFFVKGQRLLNGKAAAATVQAYKDGHEIGSHTWTHADLTKLSDGDVRTELKKTSDKIEELTGARPFLFRPPYGSHNAEVRAIAKEFGMAVILWSVDTKDWESNSSKKILEEVKKSAKPNAIILMHDTHQATVNAADNVIKWLKSQGYTIVPVGELLRMTRGLEPGVAYRSGDEPKK